MSLSKEDIAVLRELLQHALRIIGDNQVEPTEREQKVIEYRRELVGIKIRHDITRKSSMSLSKEDIDVVRANLEHALRILHDHEVKPMDDEQKIAYYRERFRKYRGRLT